MPEGTCQKNRHGDIRALAFGVLDQVAGKRELGDIEVPAAHGPKEHLFGIQQHVHRVASINLDTPVVQGTISVVVAHGDRYVQL